MCTRSLIVKKATVLKEKPAMERIAVSIPQAAEMVGVSRAVFYKKWVNGGLVKAVDLGARGRNVLLDELHTAVKTQAALQQRKAG